MKLIQISDPHLFADESGSLLGVNTRESFLATLESISQNHQNIDAIVVTGDISQDYSEESYQFFVDQMNQFDCPVHCLAGNHDESERLKKFASSNNVTTKKTLDFPHWKLLLANTQVKGKVHGLVSSEEMQWLSQELSSSKTSSIVFTHHHPININADWIDRIGIKNGTEFTNLLDQYSQVKACGFGHVHQNLEISQGHLQYLAVPSTCIQFKQNSAEFAVTEELPGYREFNCHEDGTIKTRVHRIENFELTLDKTATGY